LHLFKFLQIHRNKAFEAEIFLTFFFVKCGAPITWHQTKSLAYEYFALSSDLKYVCQCMISEDRGERTCDEKISASISTTLKAQAPTHLI